jgi:hypothetical protein
MQTPRLGTHTESFQSSLHLHILMYSSFASLFFPLICINISRVLYRIHRIFLDFFHRPVFQKKKTRRFGNWICFRPQVKVGRRHLLSWAPYRELISITGPPVSETSCFLEYRTMEKVQKNSVNSVQHTASSKSFQVYSRVVSVLLVSLLATYLAEPLHQLLYLNTLIHLYTACPESVRTHFFKFCPAMPSVGELWR